MYLFFEKSNIVFLKFVHLKSIKNYYHDIVLFNGEMFSPPVRLSCIMQLSRFLAIRPEEDRRACMSRH